MTDPMWQLAKLVSDTDYDDLAPSVVEYAKLHILDTIGVIIAGSSAAGIPEVVKVASRWGGVPESTIPFCEHKVPATSAALAIGPMARALDFGGVHPEANEHTTEYTLAAALPLAESLHRNGKDLISAVALGNEVIVRVGASVHTITPVGIAKTHSVFRIWGPVVSAAKLLGLGQSQMMNAIGLAFTQGGCDAQEFVDLVLKCRVQHGFVCSTAIQCALLAQAGITGTENVLTGQKGMYAAFFPDHDATWITRGLDAGTFFAVGTRIKGYPSCTYTHSAIEAAVACKTENNIESGDIADVYVGVNTPTYEQVCEPLDIKFRPRTPIDAQFSIPYTVANALVTDGVEISDFTEKAITRPTVLDMLRHIHVAIDPDIEATDPIGFAGAVVRIRTPSGLAAEKRIDFVKGTPQNPLTFDEAVLKFRKCMPYAARRMSEETVERLIETIRHLEDVDDVSRLSSMLSGT